MTLSQSSSRPTMIVETGPMAKVSFPLCVAAAQALFYGLGYQDGLSNSEADRRVNAYAGVHGFLGRPKPTGPGPDEEVRT
jgi:hypothetical protein